MGKSSFAPPFSSFGHKVNSVDWVGKIESPMTPEQWEAVMFFCFADDGKVLLRPEDLYKYTNWWLEQSEKSMENIQYRFFERGDQRINN